MSGDDGAAGDFDALFGEDQAANADEDYADLFGGTTTEEDGEDYGDLFGADQATDDGDGFSDLFDEDDAADLDWMGELSGDSPLDDDEEPDWMASEGDTSGFGTSAVSTDELAAEADALDWMTSLVMRAVMMGKHMREKIRRQIRR